MPYTLDDLAKAKDEVRVWSNRIANQRANNPDYGQSDLRAAIAHVERITRELKINGILEWTEKEKLERELDRKFPQARSKDIVEHNGKQYQLRFLPRYMTRSGKNVKEWDRWWQQLKD